MHIETDHYVISLKKKNNFPEDVEKTLAYYFQSCSLTMTCKSLGAIAACLANGGISPITNEEVMSKEIARDCLSLMFMCGMYDYSGQFAFDIGYPAKSGVSGCVFGVIPEKAGIAIWSPRLDRYGNSVRGIQFFKELKARADHHIFVNRNMIHENDSQENILYKFISAASRGDLEELKKYIAHVDINTTDYDGRSALHLAAESEHTEIIEYLVNNGADMNLKDRWGNTPQSIQQDHRI